MHRRFRTVATVEKSIQWNIIFDIFYLENSQNYIQLPKPNVYKESSAQFQGQFGVELVLKPNKT